jgi:TPR repeat protein
LFACATTDGEPLEDVERRARGGDAAAQYELGTARIAAGDNAGAALWLEQAVAQGHPAAAYELGVLFEGGLGVPRDYRRAASLYELAARAGRPDAMNNLGALFARGMGVEQDFESAVFWYREAAALGLPSAMANLGSAYYRGRGVAKNDVEGPR